MSKSPTSRRTSPWLPATAGVLVLLVAYVGGYFLLDEYHVNRFGSLTFHNRRFANGAFVNAYYPMCWIECRVRGEDVMLVAPMKPPDTDPFGSPAAAFEP